MRIRRSATLAVMTFVTMLVLSACGPGGSRAGESGDGSAQRNLTLAIGGESEEGYDPTLGWGRYGSPLFQSTLLRLDADLSVVPDLATGHTVSPDGRTWRVTIRPDAVFSDGEPVTAADVAYTFLTARKSPSVTDLSTLQDATAIDAHTVELTLTAPQSTFVHRLATLGIVPEHAHGPEYAQKPIGSGPFTFVQWDKGQQLIVARNDRYYGPKPAFEQVTFLFTDEDGTLAAARSGQVDMASVASSLVNGDIDGFRLTAVESIDNRGLLLPYVPDEGKRTADGRPIGNNVTSDVAVRRAINVAIDRDTLVKGVLNGYGSPATGPVDGAPWYNPKSAITDNDPDRAKQLLEAAGWRDTDGDGIREKGATAAQFTALYPAGDTLRQGLVVAVADQLKQVGIRLEPKGASWEEIDGRMHADGVLFGWGSHDPTEMFNLYSSRQAGVEYYNAGFYANPTVQKHLDEAMASSDPTAANAAWQAAQLDAQGNGFTASADAAWAWLVNLDHTYYVDECLDLGEVQTEPHGHGWPITAGITGWTWRC